MILFAVTWFAIVLAYDLYSDYRDWKQGEPINHNEGTKERIGLLTIPVIILAVPVPGSILWGLLLSALLTGFVYWTLFDGLFNRLRGMKWNYTGSIDPDDAMLDKLQRRYKWVWVAKIIISILLLTTYLISI